MQLVKSTGFGRMDFSHSYPYAQVFYVVPSDLLFFLFSFPQYLEVEKINEAGSK